MIFKCLGTKIGAIACEGLEQSAAPEDDKNT